MLGLRSKIIVCLISTPLNSKRRICHVTVHPIDYNRLILNKTTLVVLAIGFKFTYITLLTQCSTTVQTLTSCVVLYKMATHRFSSNNVQTLLDLGKRTFAQQTAEQVATDALRVRVGAQQVSGHCSDLGGQEAGVLGNAPSAAPHPLLPRWLHVEIAHQVVHTTTRRISQMDQTSCYPDLLVRCHSWYRWLFITSVFKKMSMVCQCHYLTHKFKFCLVKSSSKFEILCSLTHKKVTSCLWLK